MEIESTQQLDHWMTKASIHQQSCIQLISSTLDSPCMEHTCHDRRCQKHETFLVFYRLKLEERMHYLKQLSKITETIRSHAKNY